MVLFVKHLVYNTIIITDVLKCLHRLKSPNAYKGMKGKLYFYMPAEHSLSYTIKGFAHLQGNCLKQTVEWHLSAQGRKQRSALQHFLVTGFPALSCSGPHGEGPASPEPGRRGDPRKELCAETCDLLSTLRSCGDKGLKLLVTLARSISVWSSLFPRGSF